MLATVEIKGTSVTGHLCSHFFDAEQPITVIDKSIGSGYRSIVLLANGLRIDAVDSPNSILDMVAAARRKAAQFRHEFMDSLKED